MSVDQTDVIDFVSTKEGSRQVTLTIADHLDWDSSWETEHLFMLQEKLNAYLRFIESGELQDAFPNAIGKEVVIEIVGKYPLSEGARVFVKNAQEVIENAGFWLAFRLFKGKDDPAAG